MKRKITNATGTPSNGVHHKRHWPPWRLPSGTKSASEHAINSAIESRERWELWFGGTVIAGVVLEVLLAFANPPYGKPVEVWGPVVSDLFVAVGVVGEMLFANRARSLESELTRRSNDRLVEAEKLAAIADNHAATAWSRTVDIGLKLADAEDRAAKLEVEAAQARERTAEIERVTAWRGIPLAMADRIGDAARAFGSKRFILEFQAGDPEAYTFSIAIWHALRSGATNIVSFNANSYLSGAVFGIVASCRDGIDLASLAEIFDDFGLRLDILGHREREGVPEHDIYIFVGTKFVAAAPPSPPQVRDT